jgi:hypothetical protein
MQISSVYSLWKYEFVSLGEICVTNLMCCSRFEQLLLLAVIADNNIVDARCLAELLPTLRVIDYFDIYGENLIQFIL